MKYIWHSIAVFFCWCDIYACTCCDKHEAGSWVVYLHLCYLFILLLIFLQSFITVDWPIRLQKAAFSWFWLGYPAWSGLTWDMYAGYAKMDSVYDVLVIYLNYLLL